MRFVLSVIRPYPIREIPGVGNPDQLVPILGSQISWSLRKEQLATVCQAIVYGKQPRMDLGSKRLSNPRFRA